MTAAELSRRYVDAHNSHDLDALGALVAGSTVIAEIEVDAGPRSHEWYRGVVIHDWNANGLLVRYRLYIGDSERPGAGD